MEERRGLEMEKLQEEITFLANWNRAGRRTILQNNVLRSLWSLIVERVNTIGWKCWGGSWLLQATCCPRSMEKRSKPVYCFAFLREEAPAALFERGMINLL
jgi:hypothetical protein